MKRKLNSSLSIFGFILMIISFIIAGFLYIRSFGLWHEILGFGGYFVALFFAPDLILIIIRIIHYGFSDWYLWTFVAAGILYWLGIFISSIAQSKIDDNFNEIENANSNLVGREINAENVFDVDVIEEKENSNLLSNNSNTKDNTFKINFCRKCGTKLPEDSLFCNNCGAKIEHTS